MPSACAVLSYAVFSTVSIFSIYFIYGTIFRKKSIGHKICVLIYGRLHIKRRQFFSDQNEILNFIDRFWETFSKIRLHKNPSTEGPVVPCRQTDGQTYENNSRFCQLEKPIIAYLSSKSPASQGFISHVYKGHTVM